MKGDRIWQRRIQVENVVLIAGVAFILGLLAGRTSKVRQHLVLGGHPPLPGEMRGENETLRASVPPAPQTLEEARALVARMEGVSVEELIRLGNLKFDTNQPLLAIAFYERALELEPDNPDVHTDLGVMYLQLGEVEKARAHFKQAQTLNPQHPQSLFNLGVVYYQQGKKEKALAAWEGYLHLAPKGEKAEEVRRLVEELREQKG
ncbi:MAG TPA: tetratricopeptide repeat protein [Armatimonadetes bacterium]|nr:tetratricopeptide repeat protein [Armatimonadota bacterium]